MSTELKIKVCGMREADNITAIAAAQPDYLGFIFYKKSSRFLGDKPDFEMNELIPPSIGKVGVFVDEAPEKVIEICRHNQIDNAQLHGHESPEYCKLIQRSGIQVFKAFSVNETFDFNTLESYMESCRFFLFDTKGNLPGGTGQKFDWHLLDNYQLEVPFFLSGGIKPDDLNQIKELQHKKLYGVDINSGFEISPALKDSTKVKLFIAGIRVKTIK